MEFPVDVKIPGSQKDILTLTAKSTIWFRICKDIKF